MKNCISLRFLAVTSAVVFFAASCTKDVLEQIKPSPSVPDKETPTAPVKGTAYTLVPDAEGRLIIDGSKSTYKGGDVLYLKGNFLAVAVMNLSGTAGNPIIITNTNGVVTKIGNPGWNGGSWAEALKFDNCHYIKVGGESSKANFILDCSTQPARDAYFDLVLSKHTDNFEIQNITIRNGGTGIWAKTDPVKGDPSTHYPNSTMDNLLIHDVSISGTNNEAMYIGHTATYWDLNANTSYYGDPSGFAASGNYVQPIKWHNVKIYNNDVSNGGADGIQTAAIDQLEIYNNSVTNWGQQHNTSHNGGILIGGRTTNTNTHDNYVHDGWGELLQFYGSGENGATHIISNNLFRDNESGGNDGVSLRGANKAVVQVLNNTIVRTGGASLRINGEKGMTAPLIVSGNAFIQPRMSGGVIAPNAYIYTENGGSATLGTGDKANTTFATVSAAGVDGNNFYQPLSGSALGNSGYRKK
ncbi:right-handed parallel beta-helix repeat-containing protein [Chitinophaga sp. MM2321]|uniref:right-handed parallel beta-helix repeat-containing protein n=1 Tax=Chitinophaga sp. MM2321 TaxID=3137178 RepID=UPI0032D5947E